MDSRLSNENDLQNVFLVQTSNGTIKDTSFINKGTLQETLALKNKGLCKEITGREFSSEP
jgi:hypothetical protein